LLFSEYRRCSFSSDYDGVLLWLIADASINCVTAAVILALAAVVIVTVAVVGVVFAL
jgi:hypothetical protein